MVLGAIGSDSTAHESDEQTLIEKMFQLMQSGGMLPTHMILEQAYPFLQGLITADSARRQNLNFEETISAPQIASDGLAMWTTNRESVRHTDLDPAIGGAQELTPDQKRSVEKVLADNPQMAKDWAEAAAKRTLLTPLGIDTEESSQALAKRMELSATAAERLQMSAKSFGMIRPDDDISLPEADLLMLEQARKSFGLVIPKELGTDNSVMILLGAIPSGYVLGRLPNAMSGIEAQQPTCVGKEFGTHATPSPSAIPSGFALGPSDSVVKPTVAEPSAGEQLQAKQFLEATKHLSPEDRSNLIASVVDGNYSSIHAKRDLARDQVMKLSAKLSAIQSSVEPLYSELLMVQQQFQPLSPTVALSIEQKEARRNDLVHKAEEIGEHLLMAAGLAKNLLRNLMTPSRTKNFNIASPVDMDVQRQLQFEDHEPLLPQPLIPSEFQSSTERAAVSAIPSGLHSPPTQGAAYELKP